MGYWALRNRLVASLSAAMVVLGIVALSTIVSLWWKAEAATELAERHLLAVQETNQQLLETIGGLSQSLKVVEKNPATLHMQLEWLTNINEAYEKLQPLATLRPALRHDAAVARFKLGLVQRSVGRRDLGSETLEQAEVMFRELAQEEPGNFKHWFDVFHCLTWRGQSEEAYQVIVKVDQMSGGDVPQYRDALAHAELRRARDFLGMSRPADAEELILRAVARVDANLRVDPENGLYWKKLAECHHCRARLDILKGERIAAFASLDQADQAYARAFVLLNSDIQTLRRWFRNDGLVLSLHLDSGDWAMARAVLAASELRMVVHEELVTDGIDYYLFPAMLQEQKFILAVASENDDELLDVAKGWLEAVEKLCEAFPNDLHAQRIRLYALQMVDRFLPELELKSTIARRRKTLTPFPETVDVTGEPYQLEMVTEYLSGNEHERQVLAKGYFLSLDANRSAKLSDVHSEVPHIILDESNDREFPGWKNLESDGFPDLASAQLACWEDPWRHWFWVEAVFVQRSPER